MVSCPVIALISVDLPAPDEPNRQIVVPGVKYSFSSARPMP